MSRAQATAWLADIEAGNAEAQRGSGAAFYDHERDWTPRARITGPRRDDAAPSAGPGPAAPRRTITIRGQATSLPVAGPRLLEAERRRPPRRPAERFTGRPDRVALWAVLLGFLLVLVATTSAHAAPGLG